MFPSRRAGLFCFYFLSSSKFILRRPPPFPSRRAGLFCFYRWRLLRNMRHTFETQGVSIPTSGIVLFLPKTRVGSMCFGVIRVVVRVSIPTSGIVLFLPSGMCRWRRSALVARVSIPTSGIVLFLRGSGTATSRTRPGILFPSRRAGLFCFYHLFLQGRL